MKKKVVLIVGMVLLFLSMGGCMGRKEQLANQSVSEQYTSDQLMEKIVTALDARDEKALKSLFSKSALKESAKIEQQISKLMEFYQGTIKSFKGDASSDTRTDYGEDVEKELVGQYLLITDKNSYHVMYDYKAVDKNNPEQMGLSQLELVTDELYQKNDFDWQCGKNGSGVYMQE